MDFQAVLLPLLVKVLAAASVVVLASMAAEKAGPFFGGVIASLPVSTGPAYVLLAMEHDDAFIKAAAFASTLSNVAMILFLVTLVRVAPRAGMLITLLSASTLWIAVAVLLQAAGPWTLTAALVANGAAYLAAAFLLKAPDPAGTLRSQPGRWHDIPARAALVGGLVAAVTTVSHIIGPSATGAAAIYPIAMTSLVVILYGRMGGLAVSAAMRSAVMANPGFMLSALTAYLLTLSLGRSLALAAALGVALLWSAGLLAVRARHTIKAGTP